MRSFLMVCLAAQLLPAIGQDGAEWVARYSGVIGAQAEPCRRVLIDHNGNCYVGGVIRLPSGSSEWVLLKFDTRGHLSESWPDIGWGVGVRRFHSPIPMGYAAVTDIQLDRFGNLIAGGDVQLHPYYLSIGLVKLDRSGMPSSEWPDVGYGLGVRRFVSSQEAQCSRIAIGSDGDVFVAGRMYTDQFQHDYLLLRYSRSGLPSNHWPDNGNGVGVRIVRGPGFSHEEGIDVQVDSDGAAVSRGSCYRDIRTKIMLVKIDENGGYSATWPDLGDGVGVRIFSAGYNTLSSGLTFGERGNFYVTGTNYFAGLLVKFDAAGVPSSSWPDVGYGEGVRSLGYGYSEHFSGAKLVSDQSIVVTGDFNDVGPNSFAAKFSSNGDLKWYTRYTGPWSTTEVRLRRPIISDSGDVFMVGQFGWAPKIDYFVYRLTSRGSTSSHWRDLGGGSGARRYSGPAGAADIPTGAAVFGNVRLIVVGYSQNELIGTAPTDIAVVSFRLNDSRANSTNASP